MQIALCETDTDIDACFPVMSQLRPHLDRDFATVGLEKAGLRLKAFRIGIGDRAQYLIDPQIMIK